jgi:seryl-tRNA synthetase
MFISKEKFDALKAAHDAMAAERKQITEALALTAEATTEDVLAAIESVETTAGSEAKAKQKTAEDAIAKVATSLDDLGSSVKEATTPEAKVEAVRAILAAKPGATATEVKTEKDKIESGDGVDWDAINKLPHNIEADKNIIK